MKNLVYRSNGTSLLYNSDSLKNELEKAIRYKKLEEKNLKEVMKKVKKLVSTNKSRLDLYNLRTLSTLEESLTTHTLRIQEATVSELIHDFLLECNYDVEKIRNVYLPLFNDLDRIEGNKYSNQNELTFTDLKHRINTVKEFISYLKELNHSVGGVSSLTGLEVPENATSYKEIRGTVHGLTSSKVLYGGVSQQANLEISEVFPTLYAEIPEILDVEVGKENLSAIPVKFDNTELSIDISKFNPNSITIEVQTKDVSENIIIEKSEYADRKIPFNEIKLNYPTILGNYFNVKLQDAQLVDIRINKTKSSLKLVTNEKNSVAKIAKAIKDIPDSLVNYYDDSVRKIVEEEQKEQEKINSASSIVLPEGLLQSSKSNSSMDNDNKITNINYTVNLFDDENMEDYISYHVQPEYKDNPNQLITRIEVEGFTLDNIKQELLEILNRNNSENNPEKNKIIETRLASIMEKMVEPYLTIYNDFASNYAVNLIENNTFLCFDFTNVSLETFDRLSVAIASLNKLVSMSYYKLIDLVPLEMEGYINEDLFPHYMFNPKNFTVNSYEELEGKYINSITSKKILKTDFFVRTNHTTNTDMVKMEMTLVLDEEKWAKSLMPSVFMDREEAHEYIDAMTALHGIAYSILDTTKPIATDEEIRKILDVSHTEKRGQSKIYYPIDVTTLSERNLLVLSDVLRTIKRNILGKNLGELLTVLNKLSNYEPEEYARENLDVKPKPKEKKIPTREILLKIPYEKVIDSVLEENIQYDKKKIIANITPLFSKFVSLGINLAQDTNAPCIVKVERTKDEKSIHFVLQQSDDFNNNEIYKEFRELLTAFIAMTEEKDLMPIIRIANLTNIDKKVTKISIPIPEIPKQLEPFLQKNPHVHAPSTVYYVQDEFVYFINLGKQMAKSDNAPCIISVEVNKQDNCIEIKHDDEQAFSTANTYTTFREIIEALTVFNETGELDKLLEVRPPSTSLFKPKLPLPEYLTSEDSMYTLTEIGYNEYTVSKDNATINILPTRLMDNLYMEFDVPVPTTETKNRIVRDILEKLSHVPIISKDVDEEKFMFKFYIPASNRKEFQEIFNLLNEYTNGKKEEPMSANTEELENMKKQFPRYFYATDEFELVTGVVDGTEKYTHLKYTETPNVSLIIQEHNGKLYVGYVDKLMIANVNKWGEKIPSVQKLLAENPNNARKRIGTDMDNMVKKFAQKNLGLTNVSMKGQIDENGLMTMQTITDVSNLKQNDCRNLFNHINLLKEYIKGNNEELYNIKEDEEDKSSPEKMKEEFKKISVNHCNVINNSEYRVQIYSTYVQDVLKNIPVKEKSGTVTLSLPKGLPLYQFNFDGAEYLVSPTLIYNGAENKIHKIEKNVNEMNPIIILLSTLYMNRNNTLKALISDGKLKDKRDVVRKNRLIELLSAVESKVKFKLHNTNEETLLPEILYGQDNNHKYSILFTPEVMILKSQNLGNKTYNFTVLYERENPNTTLSDFNEHAPKFLAKLPQMTPYKANVLYHAVTLAYDLRKKININEWKAKFN